MLAPTSARAHFYSFLAHATRGPPKILPVHVIDVCRYPANVLGVLPFNQKQVYANCDIPMAQGGSRPVPVRRSTDGVDMSSKRELIQSFSVGSKTSSVSDHQIRLARKCISAILVRGIRYELIPFHMVLQWNQEKDNRSRTIAGACEILLKYTTNLLIPRRPLVWRAIKTTGSLFRARVDCMIGARDILKMIGYTEEDSNTLRFPDQVKEPDRDKLCVIAAELLMAKLETEDIQSVAVTPTPANQPSSLSRTPQRMTIHYTHVVNSY